MCQVIQRFGVSLSVGCKINCLTPVQFPGSCQMVFPSACIVVQQSRGTHEDILLSHALILLSFLHSSAHTQMLLARSGTVYNSPIYCPIIYLFFCIYRPFTEQIYLQRHQHHKHDWSHLSPIVPGLAEDSHLTCGHKLNNSLPVAIHLLYAWIQENTIMLLV